MFCVKIVFATDCPDAKKLKLPLLLYMDLAFAKLKLASAIDFHATCMNLQKLLT